MFFKRLTFGFSMGLLWKGSSLKASKLEASKLDLIFWQYCHSYAPPNGEYFKTNKVTHTKLVQRQFLHSNLFFFDLGLRQSMGTCWLFSWGLTA